MAKILLHGILVFTLACFQPRESGRRPYIYQFGGHACLRIRRQKRCGRRDIYSNFQFQGGENNLKLLHRSSARSKFVLNLRLLTNSIP